MLITCPHCQYAKDMNQAWIPQGDSRVECPECNGTFYFSHTQGISIAPPQAPVEKTHCPSCGVEQPKGDHCNSCGIVYAKWQKRQQSAEPEDEEFGFEGGAAPSFSVRRAPKGGFWIRFAALIIDSLVLTVIQVVLAIALFGMEVTETFMLLVQANQGTLDPATYTAAEAKINAFVASFMTFSALVTILSLLYFVVPTAISGRTLGKKICGLRVVSENEKVGLLRAILRETIGKMISAAIFYIGFLMAAFHKEKRGLHDLIAGTWVVKG